MDILIMVIVATVVGTVLGLYMRKKDNIDKPTVLK